MTQGPPLVFIHGAGGSRLHWPPALRRLPGVRALAVDLPGHGASPPGEESSIEGYAARLGAWQRIVGARPAVLVGHSMGSAIALTLALEGGAAALVLVGAGPRLRVNPALLEGTARRESFAEAVGRIVRWSFARAAPRRLVETAQRRMLEVAPAVLHRDLLACDAFDASARLGEIDVPTLIVHGAEDRMTPPALGEELACRLRAARRETIEGAGHMVMLERPEAVARLLLDFLLVSVATSRGGRR